MNIEDIRQKYQRDASQTFAQWKDWVRKNKPSQAQAHVVKAVAPNGGNYERVFGGYTDAQNAASDLVSHGYKDVKLFSSVNAGPLKLLRKFKDSVDAVDSIREKYCMVPESVKKYFDKRNAAATNKEFQAAKKRWLAEMDKFLDGKIKVQPKMPRLEDYLKR